MDIDYLKPHIADLTQKNTGKTPLKILCCCSPAYSNEDTELLE